MSWLQLQLPVEAPQLEALEAVLFDTGAVSITLLSHAGEPVLEPAPGDTPLWSSIIVQALFDLDCDVRQLRHQLQESGFSEPFSVDFIAQQDWDASINNHAVDEVIGDRLWLRRRSKRDTPSDRPIGTATQGPDSAPIPLYLQPGLAFGSGTHPTTRMCLAWLATHIGVDCIGGEVSSRGSAVLDFGCGSGILALAAVVLGANAVAVDHDDQAVLATLDNAAFNGIDASTTLGEATLTVLHTRQWSQAEQPLFDVVVANILAEPLKFLAEEIQNQLLPGGSIVLSGILEDQAQAVMSHYPNIDFATPRLDGGWCCLVGTRQS